MENLILTTLLLMHFFRRLSLLSLIIVLSACGGDDDSGISEEQQQLVMGDATGTGVVQLGLTAPITIAQDQVHITQRELDINFDGIIDITIRAFEEFGGNPKGLTVTTNNTETRILLDGNGVVMALNSGDIVTVLSETWAFSDQLPLALLSGQNTTGLWNGVQNKFMAVRMDIGGSRFLAWIELSVADYDNYSFHNYALKQVP